MGKGQAAVDALAEAVQRGWLAMKAELIDVLIGSMNRRVITVNRVKGWHTKY